MVTEEELYNLIEEYLIEDIDSNENQTSYYHFYNKSGKCIRTRISDHLTYLRTWVENGVRSDVKLDLSTNICIIFAQDIKEATTITKNHCKFTKHSVYNKLQRMFKHYDTPKFSVKCFVYNCKVLDRVDVEAILNRMQKMLSQGQPYTDDFVTDSTKRAVQFTLTSKISESLNNSLSGLSDELIADILNIVYEDFLDMYDDVIDTDLIDKQVQLERLKKYGYIF